MIETTISPDYFTVEYVSKNGSYVYGVPIKTGKTKVQVCDMFLDIYLLYPVINFSYVFSARLY